MKLAKQVGWFAVSLLAGACSSPDAPPTYSPLNSVATGLGATGTTTGASSSAVVTGSTATTTESAVASVTTSGASNATSTSGLPGATGGSGGAATTGSQGNPTNGGFQNASTTGSSTTEGTPMGSGAGGMGAATTTGGSMEGCESGPLDAPLPNCSPEPVPDTGDYYADCVERINQFRWECQCLPPLERWVEAEDCADQHAEYDYQQDSAHAGFQDRICSPGGNAQNECPGYGANFGIVDFCLQQMWDEGPGEDFQAHGHYLNMSNERFSRVACGMYVTPNGEIWAVQNFE